MMKLILEKDVKNLGKAGDKVSVKPGYARNWLIPQKAASVLNESRLKEWKHKQHIIAVRKKTAEKLREKTLSQLKQIRLVFEKEARPADGRLFGSLPPAEIAKALLEKHKLSIDKKDIRSDPLKTAGEHQVKISLDPEREVLVPVIIKQIVKKSAEASADAPEDAEDSAAGARPATDRISADRISADRIAADSLAANRIAADGDNNNSDESGGGSAEAAGGSADAGAKAGGEAKTVSSTAEGEQNKAGGAPASGKPGAKTGGGGGSEAGAQRSKGEAKADDGSLAQPLSESSHAKSASGLEKGKLSPQAAPASDNLPGDSKGAPSAPSPKTAPLESQEEPPAQSSGKK